MTFLDGVMMVDYKKNSRSKKKSSTATTTTTEQIQAEVMARIVGTFGSVENFQFVQRVLEEQSRMEPQRKATIDTLLDADPIVREAFGRDPKTYSWVIEAMKAERTSSTREEIGIRSPLGEMPIHDALHLNWHQAYEFRRQQNEIELERQKEEVRQDVIDRREAARQPDINSNLPPIEFHKADNPAECKTYADVVKYRRSESNQGAVWTDDHLGVIREEISRRDGESGLRKSIAADLDITVQALNAVLKRERKFPVVTQDQRDPFKNVVKFSAR